MASPVGRRPFDDFRLAITDPRYFFGRDAFLQTMRQTPFEVRFLLGGRRVGKTSTLRAVEWSLLAPLTGGPYRAFPVFISLEVEQPESLAHLRYVLCMRLQEAMDRWQQARKAARRDVYDRFLHQWPGKVTLTLPFQLFKWEFGARERRLMHDDFRRALLRRITKLRTWQFEGVCFLLDEAEFIVRQPWANDAWSYFRGLKDTDTALKPFLGLLLSGYRDMKEYEQRVGSPLRNIARVEWLEPLHESETRALITRRTEDERVALSEADIVATLEWAGSHPFLTQQMLNVLFDTRQDTSACTVEQLVPALLRQHQHNFAGWWNADQRSDGFGDVERTVYRALVTHREGTAESLAQGTDYSPLQVADALEVLVGTGIVRRIDDERYVIGARLFEVWVEQQRPGLSQDVSSS